VTYAVESGAAKVSEYTAVRENRKWQPRAEKVTFSAGKYTPPLSIPILNCLDRGLTKITITPQTKLEHMKHKIK
jgi:hypothetical protein